MMPVLSAAAIRIIAMIAAALVLIGVTVFAVKSCDKRSSEAAQSRVDASQASAASNSASAAVGTVAASGEAAAASEQLTRENEQNIRAANGSDVAVSNEADAAGRAALCKRDAYRNDPQCKGK